MQSRALCALQPNDRADSALYAQRIIAALPQLATRRVSMHDRRGRVCWQSTDVWSPEEHDAVRMALEQFSGPTAPLRATLELSGQCSAVLLRAADRRNEFRGFVMIVADNRQLRGRGASIRDLPVPVQRAVHEWAARLAEAGELAVDAGAAGDQQVVGSAQRGRSTSETELTPAQTHQLLGGGPMTDDAELDEYFRRLRGFPLALVAQPLVPVQAGIRIKRYEVLLRDAGAMARDAAPLELLREADSKGLGDVLDRRAAGALLVWLAGHRQLFVDEPSQFSLNLSATTLADPNFLRFIELCIAKAEVPPRLLSFEVDEKLWRAARTQVERFGSALQALGAGLVIDDCSLHESTPELMSVQAVGLVKIARPLTSRLAQDRKAQMRVGALAQMARIAGAHTVAKCVDDVDERHQLQALGVDFVQGHTTAGSLPLPELAAQSAARIVVDPDIPEAILRG